MRGNAGQREVLSGITRLKNIPVNDLIIYYDAWIGCRPLTINQYQLTLNCTEIFANLRTSSHISLNTIKMSESAPLGQDFTRNVIEAMGPNTSPRLRTVMTSLIQHVHDFAREVDLTMDEWLTGVNMINWAGQMSTDRRNEGQLLCDVIGLES